ncbi:MAG: hypothetical protein LBG27_12015 [Spirochaetaceae bacterium]|nr:hypothetical protein [Spirochaetaceae bacterium]
MIRAAAAKDSLRLTLTAETEEVSLDTDDLPAEGLVLQRSGDPASSTSPANVTIDGRGRTVDLTGSTPGALITVGDGVTLTLRNITLRGLDNNKDGSGEGENNAALIKVVGGHLILEDGAVIRDNHGGNGGSDYAKGGGVYVERGTFAMNGGAIRGNAIGSNSRGGGVYAGGGTFTMNGGEISGNTIGIYGIGGGVFVGGGTFILDGGGISGNISGPTSYGGGVFVGEGEFTMERGTIRDNKADCRRRVCVRRGHVHHERRYHTRQ